MVEAGASPADQSVWMIWAPRADAAGRRKSTEARIAFIYQRAATCVAANIV